MSKGCASRVEQDVPVAEHSDPFADGPTAGLDESCKLSNVRSKHGRPIWAAADRS